MDGVARDQWRGPELGECDGEDAAILTIGHIGNEAVKAITQLNTEGYYPAHYDLRFVKPLDEALLHEVFKKFKKN